MMNAVNGVKGRHRRRDGHPTKPAPPVSLRAAWPRLHDWEVVEGGSFDLAPEMRPVKLKGMVTNHAHLADGEITTSLVQVIDESQGLARTLGTSYALGAPSAKFAAQLVAQGMRRPLRYYNDPVTRTAEQQACKALWATRTRCASPHQAATQPSSEVADFTLTVRGEAGGTKDRHRGPSPLSDASASRHSPLHDITLTASGEGGGEAGGEAEDVQAGEEADELKASYSSATLGPRPPPPPPSPLPPRRSRSPLSHLPPPQEEEETAAAVSVEAVLVDAARVVTTHPQRASAPAAYKLDARSRLALKKLGVDLTRSGASAKNPAALEETAVSVVEERTTAVKEEKAVEEATVSLVEERTTAVKEEAKAGAPQNSPVAITDLLVSRQVSALHLSP